MEDGILSLKWNNHNSTFIQTLSTLHNAETYSDVTIACDGRYFPVHKLVLSVCSEYFEEILSRTKCQHPVIVLKDIKHRDLEALLNYMYAGEANVSQNELAGLIKAAECLRIKGLAVPDEAPPVRDKKRQTDVLESPNFNKRKRNDEVLNSNQQVYRESDSRVSEQAKSDTLLEPSTDHLTDVSGDRTVVATHEAETYRNIPEIILEGQAVEVKQEVTEPKIEEHIEDESHHQLESSNLNLAYDVDIVEESNEGDRQAHESHILQDLMTHSVPGPSGVQGHESLTNWENNANNIAGYSVDSYSSDEGRNQQLDASGLGRSPSTPQQQQQQVFECPYCPRAFLYRSDLTRHLRSHTGEKPFTCPFCSYRGTQKTHLHEHIKRKHKTFPEIYDSSGVYTGCPGSVASAAALLHIPAVWEEVPKPASPASPRSDKNFARSS